MVITGVASLLFVAAAGWAERRRLRRRNLEAVGIVPWSLLSIIAAFVGLFALAMAVKGWG